MILGALAVDNGATYLGQRQLDSDVQAAVADAAGAAVSSGAFYGQGAVRIDPVRAAAVVCENLQSEEGQRLFDTTAEMAVVGAAVYVIAHAEVQAVFGSLIPGFARRAVTAEAGAVAAGDPAATSPAPPSPADYTELPCSS